VIWGADLIEDEALTACMTAVPIVVTSRVCSKGTFPSLSSQLQKTAHFIDIHIPEETATEKLKTNN